MTDIFVFVDSSQVTADGAYDEEPTYKTILDRQSDIAVVIPPRVGAVPSQMDDVLKRLPNHPVTKLTELLPFNWRPVLS